jgi:hypothetical protein
VSKSGELFARFVPYKFMGSWHGQNVGDFLKSEFTDI